MTNESSYGLDTQGQDTAHRVNPPTNIPPSSLECRPRHLRPLKTVLELKAGDSTIDAYATVVPIKSANTVLNAVRALVHDQHVIDLQHLRRFAKLNDLPAHLKSSLLCSESVAHIIGDPGYLCLLVAPTISVDLPALEDCLSRLLPSSLGKKSTIWTVSVPLLAPTSQCQAAEWTVSHWPTIYKKNNPFGPHPHILSLAENEITSDPGDWMVMAQNVAEASEASGIGEAIGAVIVYRAKGSSHALALAGDARWAEGKGSPKGNIIAHAALRAIGIIAQKLKKLERENTCMPPRSSLDELESAIFLDKPLLDEEYAIFNDGNTSPDGYLCHNLEIYLTHEPCVMCSMALLHSRFGRVIFDLRMPTTGGLCGDKSTVQWSEFLMSTPPLGGWNMDFSGGKNLIGHCWHGILQKMKVEMLDVTYKYNHK